MMPTSLQLQVSTQTGFYFAPAKKFLGFKALSPKVVESMGHFSEIPQGACVKEAAHVNILNFTSDSSYLSLSA